MKVVFMGTPEFALRQLNELVLAGHQLVLVVTAPERRAGRGRKLKPTPVKTAAQEAALPVITPEDVNAPDALEQIANVEPDVIVVAAFGQKLGEGLLRIARLGCFNVHASSLPKYRGAAPINWALIKGEETTGVTIQSMVAEIDAGAVAVQKEVSIAPKWNVLDLTRELAELGATLLRKVMGELEAGTLELTAQPIEDITRARRLKKSDGIIDWTRPAQKIHNLIRGVTPWPGGQTAHVDNRDNVLNLLLTETMAAESEIETGEPGEIVALGDDGIDVACGEGVLRILKLKPAGKREMTAAQFLRGHRWQTGEKLTTRIQNPEL